MRSMRSFAAVMIARVDSATRIVKIASATKVAKIASAIKVAKVGRRAQGTGLKSMGRRLFYIAFAIIVLLTSWESNQMDAAVVQTLIPDQSIRVRILANSDQPADQWIKRKVRDALVEQMKGWVGTPQTIEEAREGVEAKLPQLRELVGQVLRGSHFDYNYEVELGIVAFPVKIFGGQVYPAGDYEALRVTLGHGAGENWWCVLFPPLCFVDLVGKAKDTSGKTLVQNESIPMGSVRENGELEVEVRFFVWDMLKGVPGFVRGLF